MLRTASRALRVAGLPGQLPFGRVIRSAHPIPRLASAGSVPAVFATLEAAAWGPMLAYDLTIVK
jgi:hypothetical protein